MSPRVPIDDRERRRTILDAALACFLQFGYAKTSLDDIAKRAGISRPLLYRKYANKEEILGAVYDDIFESRYPLARAALAERGSKRTKLAKLAEILLVEPWELVVNAPMVDEFYAVCERVSPEIHAKHDKRMVELVQSLLLDRELTTVFILAIDGFYTDRPPPSVLRKRLRLLIDRFT